ncbi:chlorophyll synthase ChlG [uncultured Enterovirga sp.]|uniref:chlorophyll synthase ChlG n=1 Tax=uncultured Enterovirga sp. TaxID=2026352 RepID=UPI0035CAB465
MQRASALTAPDRSRPDLAVVLELLKPITWFAPMWAFLCGVVSSGGAIGNSWLLLLGGVILCGPCVCATSQAANDWFDRHVDAINEPDRPIPSGRMPGRWGLYIAFGWTLLSLLVAAPLGPWAFAATILGLTLAWAYSAPPFRLKENGWWGNAAVGFCYEGLPWFTGAAIMAGSLPDGRVLATLALYSLGAHGIMTLNDFKSVEGDRRMGVRSLPATLGIDTAARLACWVMAVPQVVVAVLLFAWNAPWHGGAVVALLAAQGALMARLLAAPRERAPWYNATGTTLYVLGMLVAAFALSRMGAPS